MLPSLAAIKAEAPVQQPRNPADKPVQCQACSHYNPDDTREVDVNGLAKYMVHSGFPKCRLGTSCLVMRRSKCGPEGKLFTPITANVGSKPVAPVLNSTPASAEPHYTNGHNPASIEAGKQNLAKKRRRVMPKPKGLAESIPLEQQVKTPTAGSVPVHFVDDGDTDADPVQ